ncbi:MAG: hypothetical protein ACRDL8_06300, partial [Solirubrobacteraceae bacterium]
NGGNSRANLTLVVPGGGESFFVEAGRRAEGDGLPPAGPPDVGLLKRVAARFGSEIIGPPMTSHEAGDEVRPRPTR